MMSSDFQLDYGGFIVGAHAADAADREWLVEFLAPQFKLTQGMCADAEVSFTVDRAAYAELEASEIAASDELYDAFVLDTSTLRFPGRVSASSGEHTRMAFDPERRSFFVVGPGAHVRIVSDDRDLARLSWMRVVREFAMHSLLRRGGLVLHAACFSVAGRCIVIAGTKGSGKTTTLTWCLALLEKAGFVANDRLYVRPDGAGYDARGMPTVMTFRPRSLELLPRFATDLVAIGGNHRLSSSEQAAAGGPAPAIAWPDGRFALTPGRYAEMLGRESVAAGRVAAIVFPEVLDGDSGLEAVALPAAAASKRIRETLFGVLDLHRRSRLFDHPASGQFPSADEIRARADRIVAHVPSYSWKVGSRAPRDAASLHAFLGALD